MACHARLLAAAGPFLTHDEGCKPMKLIALLLLCLPLFVSAADHGGAAAESKEHGGAPAETKDADTATADDEHSGEHAGAPAEEKE
jgi:hypothetical protein